METSRAWWGRGLGTEPASMALPSNLWILGAGCAASLAVAGGAHSVGGSCDGGRAPSGHKDSLQRPHVCGGVSPRNDSRPLGGTRVPCPWDGAPSCLLRSDTFSPNAESLLSEAERSPCSRIAQAVPMARDNPTPTGCEGTEETACASDLGSRHI